MLKVLYSLAISLLVVFFIGFGISAFYPAPDYPGPYDASDEQAEPKEAMHTPPENRTPAQKEKIEEFHQNQKAFQEAQSTYNLVVSSISIGGAILLLVGSIVWLSSLAVIGDGVALGAVFTLFYGLIRAFVTESEVFRFIAVAIALVVVVALVYVRFVRPTSRGTGPPQGTEALGT